MGFERLAFFFAHLGLLIYIHCQPNGLGVFGFGQSHRLDIWLWLRLVLRLSCSCGGESYSYHWSAA